MEEKNPLEFHIYVPQPKRYLQSNKRGRPSLEKAKKFSPQPKSIVSQLLNKAQEKNYDFNNEDVILNQVTGDVPPYTKSIFEKDVNHQINSNLDLTCSEDSHENFTDSYVSHKNEQKDCQVTNAAVASVWKFQPNHLVECNNIPDQLSLQQRYVLKHDKKHTSGSKIAEIICYVCSNRSSSNKAHKAHMGTHRDQPHVCNFPNCNYSCKLSSNLIKHKRIHTSEKPYLCDQCTFRSNFGNSLKVHKRTHTSERPYGCQYCSYRCNSSSNLKKHSLHRHQAVS